MRVIRFVLEVRDGADELDLWEVETGTFDVPVNETTPPKVAATAMVECVRHMLQTGGYEPGEATYR